MQSVSLPIKIEGSISKLLIYFFKIIFSPFQRRTSLYIYPPIINLLRTVYIENVFDFFQELYVYILILSIETLISEKFQR